MATISDRRTAGGKISTRRRAPAASRTPYSRPEKPPATPQCEDPENPNWLSSLIYPAKVIASGAGKILSFFGADEESSSSSDGDYEENDDGEEVENDISMQGDDQSNKAFLSSTKSDSKHAIEQLVMQETFSREEGNELIQLIKSRIVDTEGAPDENAANVRTTAIMEARKWLQEKRSGSKKKLVNEHDANLATPSQAVRNEKGSPVDVAKSYMQNRPPWASPSLKNSELGSSPLPSMQRLMEETPKPTFRSSELRSSYTSGSWNILEEIRRVRSKATQELLAATPLTEIGLCSQQNNVPQDSLMNDRDVEVAAPAVSAQDRQQTVIPDAVLGLPSSSRADQDGGDAGTVEHHEHQEAVDIKSKEENEANDLRSKAAENGFQSSISSLSARQDTQQKPSEDGNMVDTTHDVHMVDNLNPQQEPAIDVPTTEPTEAVVNGSQNISSIHLDDLSQELSQANAERPSRAKGSDNPKERKSRGYTRKSRGRGK